MKREFKGDDYANGIRFNEAIAMELFSY